MTTSISATDFENLLTAFERSSVHLEMREAYGTEVELPHMGQWAAGEPDDLAWLDGWCDTVRGHVAAGRTVRRARVVCEPLSDYQRWSHSIAYPMVAAGEDIRWVPRRLASSIAVPGNDFYLFDDTLVVFLIYAGNGLAVDRLASREPADIKLCRTAFDAAWRLATPHRDYQPT
ncbi:DUF6879 family protein [Fodinicola feengrottensis]|uniref:DUF6879 domain-containing protein n=1 Tax=Fodinicola feengrottensis TaxID=435914 RepID=A0ABN2GLV7_9ACTN|nr:DUF6879 family protein [Fodinicola feengrottensis]